MCGWKRLREEKKNGVSLAIVLCAAAFFIAFAVAILYTSGLLTAQATERLKRERCYQLAKSYAEVLDKEIQAFENKDESGTTGTFYAFANKFLDGSYAEYNAEDPENTVFYYRPSDESGVDAAYGDLVIALYKEKDENEDNTNLLEGTLAVGTGDYTTEIEKVEKLEIRQYDLTVEVTASYDGESYTYSTEYYRKEKYEAIFSHNGNTLVWSTDPDGSSYWHVGTSGGSKYGENITADNPIQYKLNKNKTTESVFVPVYEEGD